MGRKTVTIEPMERPKGYSTSHVRKRDMKAMEHLHNHEDLRRMGELDTLELVEVYSNLLNI